MTYRIFGYGSLISRRSLGGTLADADRTFTPAVVKGYRRVFNYKEERDRDPDMLNLVKDGRAHVNGVVFEVTEEELAKLKAREDVYNFEPVIAHDFETGKKIGECLASVDPYINIDHDGNLPDKAYFLMCRQAAYAVSKAFGKMWDETTYTAKGERVSEWLEKHPQYRS